MHKQITDYGKFASGSHQIKDAHRVASSSNSDHNADDDEQSQVSLQVQGHKARKIPPQEDGVLEYGGLLNC